MRLLSVIVGRQFIQEPQRMLVFSSNIDFGIDIINPINVCSPGSVQLLDFVNALKVGFLQNSRLDLRLGEVPSRSEEIGLVVTHFDVIETLIAWDIELPKLIGVPPLGQGIYTMKKNLGLTSGLCTLTASFTRTPQVKASAHEIVFTFHRKCNTDNWPLLVTRTEFDKLFLIHHFKPSEDQISAEATEIIQVLT